MVSIKWSPQTTQEWDPLATQLTIPIQIGGVELPVFGVLDPGADWTDLQPPLFQQYGIDEDQHGFSTLTDKGIVTATVPVVIGIARLDDHEFPMPVTLYPFTTRGANVFGRAGLLDHFHITLDPVAATTTFEWRGLSKHNRLDQIKRLFIDERIGQRQQFLGKKVQ